MILNGVQGLLHGGDYNPEQWLEQKDTIWKQDMEYAKKAGVNTLSIGIFSWSHLEPEDGVYDFGWMDEVMDMLADNGIKAILATPSGARPPWLAQKYPSVLRVTNEGLQRPFGARHNGCVSSPDFRRKVTEINTKLAERYKNHPALGMWHVSNEYNNDCHCPNCEARFREWCKARYGTLDALNHAWWNSFWSHKYTDWEQIVSPTWPSMLGEHESVGHILAWKRFTSDNLIDFFRMEIEPLKRITPDIPVTTNLMHTFEPIDYFKLGRSMDYSSWDNYPDWKGDDRDRATCELASFRHDLMRGVCDQRPFLMMESCPGAVNWMEHNSLRAPGTVLFQGLQAIAQGSDSVQYFQLRAGRGGSEQFHGAVIERSGRDDTRTFREVAEVGQALKQLAPVAGSVMRNRVGLVYDWESRWAVEGAWMLHRYHQKYEETLVTHHSAFCGAGYGVDMIDQLSDLSRYKVVSAPMSFLLREGFSERIADFVREGGTFVATYADGYVDPDGLTFYGDEPKLLRDVVGVRPEEIDGFDEGRPNRFTWNGKTYSIKEVAELSHPASDTEVLSVYEQQFYAGMPVLTKHACGKGLCYYVAARTDVDFLRDFYAALCNEAGLAPLAKLDDGVVATLREGEQGRFLFLQNQLHQSAHATLDRPMRDMLTGERITDDCALSPLSIRVLTDA